MRILVSSTTLYLSRVANEEDSLCVLPGSIVIDLERRGSALSCDRFSGRRDCSSGEVVLSLLAEKGWEEC